MNGRTLILMLIAIAVAIATVTVIKNRSQPTQTGGGPKVLVATVDIPAGSFVRADKQLSWAEWPQGSLSPSFVTTSNHKLEEYNGGVARRTILAGEPITDVAIVRANEGGFMSAVLIPGKRAVSISVNPTSGNAGFVFPGDKVDLILTHKVPGGMLASETFIEDVRVLAIDQMLDNPENKAVIVKTITLEVAPKQAEMINVAASLGSISVSLRSLSSVEKKPIVSKTLSKDTDAPSVTDDGGYSTDNDVSKLMDDKNSAHAKVSVYHGGAPEQLNFR